MKKPTPPVSVAPSVPFAPPLPTLLDIMQQFAGRIPPPVVDIGLEIGEFRNLLNSKLRSPAATPHRMILGAVHPNVELTPPLVVLAGAKTQQQRLRVRNDGATLRFSVEATGDAEIYNVIAVTFARDDDGIKEAIYFNTGHQTGAYSPFSAPRLNGTTFQFTITLIGHQQGVLQKRLGASGGSNVDPITQAFIAPPPDPNAPPRNLKKSPWTTYKFSVLLQRQRDGALGIIDPPIETDSDPQADFMVSRS